VQGKPAALAGQFLRRQSAPRTQGLFHMRPCVQTPAVPKKQNKTKQKIPNQDTLPSHGLLLASIFSNFLYHFLFYKIPI
jgi:hypothetical protein